MKFKTNISALFLAILVFASSNGIALFEHICNTSNTRSFCLFSPPTCENEKPTKSCCEEKSEKKQKDCCEHKEIFSKLNIEGFTEKIFKLKTTEIEIFTAFFTPFSTPINQQILDKFYVGVPPPNNIYTIQYLLRPTPVALNVFRC